MAGDRGQRMRKPSLITEAGRRALGDLIKQCREAQGWSLEDLSVELRIRTGEKLARSTLNNMERAVNMPAWDTLAILAAVGYIKDPGSGRLLTVHDLFDICTETYPGNRQQAGKRRGLRVAAEDDTQYLPRPQALAY